MAAVTQWPSGWSTQKCILVAWASFKNVYHFPAECLNHGQLLVVEHSVSCLPEVVLGCTIGILGGRQNRSYNQTICQGWNYAGAFLHFSKRKEELFLLVMSLFQNLFEIYVIRASERVRLFWQRSGGGDVWYMLLRSCMFFEFFFPQAWYPHWKVSSMHKTQPDLRN